MSLDFGNDDDAPGGGLAPDDERDLLIVLPLSNRQMGTNDERAEIAMLADNLEQAVLDAGIGEYDGDEYGGGECILFFCGPDEMELIGFLRPLLQRTRFARGAQFVRLVEQANGEMRREKISV